MSDTLAGAGNFAIETLNLSTNILFVPQPIGIEFGSETSKLIARALKRRIVDVASALSSESTTATLTYEVVNKDHLAYFVNRQWQESSTIPWPVVKMATIPKTAPYEIADADITAANESGVLVYLEADSNNTNEKSLLPVSAAPSAGEVQADGTNSKLIFNAAEAGGKITYKVPKIWSTGRTLCYEPTSEVYGAVEFVGVIYTARDEEIGIRVHNMSPDNRPVFNFNGEVPSLSQEFTCTVPSGKETPFEFFDIDSLVA